MDGDDDAARLRLVQEVADTRQRLVLGGLFYLVGWCVGAGFAGLPSRQPWLAAGIAALFLVLAFLRLRLRRRDPAPGLVAQHGWLDQAWIVVLSTCALWGGVVAWALLDDTFAPSRVAVLICSVAFGTAMAHNFSMRRERALLAILLMYAPAPALLATDAAARAEAVTLAVYLLYLVLSLFRSHAEYQRQLDLDDQLRHQRDLFAQQSRTDALTGLANRRHFNGALERACADARGAGTPLSLLILDLDHFKRVNDQHGHDAGDACLARFGERLREHFQLPNALLARLGGEEFAVLLPGIAPVAAAAHAEGLRASLAAQPLLLRDGPVPVSVSIGVAGPGEGDAGDGAELYRAADRALYRAKSEGRDRVRIDGA